MLILRSKFEIRQSRVPHYVSQLSSIFLFWMIVSCGNQVLGQSPSPLETQVTPGSDQVSITVSKDIIIAVLGSGALLAAFVAIYRARSDKRSVDIANANNAYQLGLTHGAAQKFIEMNTQLFVKDQTISRKNFSSKTMTTEQVSVGEVNYQSPEHPVVNLDLIKNYMQSIGLKNFLQIDEKSLIFGIGGEEELDRTFLISVLDNREVQINSFSVDVKKEDVKPSLLIRLLSLNSENKRGQIGLQERDNQYRIWVDQNILLVGMGLSLEAFRVNIFSVSGVHLEIEKVLKEEGISFTQAKPG